VPWLQEGLDALLSQGQSCEDATLEKALTRRRLFRLLGLGVVASWLGWGRNVEANIYLEQHRFIIPTVTLSKEDRIRLTMSKDNWIISGTPYSKVNYTKIFDDQSFGKYRD